MLVLTPPEQPPLAGDFSPVEAMLSKHRRGDIRRSLASMRGQVALARAAASCAVLLLLSSGGGAVAERGRQSGYPGRISAEALTPVPGGVWYDDGDQEQSQFGFIASGAGDVNNDGYDDLLVGAPMYDNAAGNSGRVVLYLGSATGLSPTPGWTFEGDQNAAELGACVAGAGDVNGDGYDDVIVAASYYDKDHPDAGRVYVFYGEAGGLPAEPSWEIWGDIPKAHLGRSVDGAGDVNGDGYDDVVIGSFNYRNPDIKEGRAYVYHGGPGGLSYTPAWMAEGNQAYAYFAMAVAGAGDVNADGYDDILIGAPNYDAGPNENAGRAYLFLSDSTGVAADPVWIFEGTEVNEYLGRSVDGAGDLNNDGYDDVIVGAPGFDGDEQNEGLVLVFYGTASGVSATPGLSMEGNNAEAQYGFSVAGVGDINNDGYDDAGAGAHTYSNGAALEGKAFVYPGGGEGLSSIHAWSAEGNMINVTFGYCIAAAGDINNDGYDDIAVGSPDYTDDQLNEGRVFVYAMGPDTAAPVVEVGSPNGGEIWNTGITYEVRWSAADFSGVDYVNLYYSLDGGGSFLELATAESNDESYSWTIPDVETDSALVRIVAYDPHSNAGEDISDAFFRMFPDTIGPSVDVLSPDGGETFYIACDHEIGWLASDDNGVDSVTILYSVDRGKNYTVIAAGEPNDSTFSWTVPDTRSNRAMVMIEAYDSLGNLGYGESAATFDIAADIEAPTVTVIAPDGGERWAAGAPRTIEWIATDNSGVDSVSLYYSADGGQGFTLISSAEPNDSSFAWVVPGAYSDSAIVKVVAYDRLFNVGEDLSDGLFSIVPDTIGPTVSVDSPNGGEVWGTGAQCVITWSAEDPAGVDSVSIYYSLDAGETYHIVSSGEENDSSYLWDVPDTPSDSALIMIVAYDRSVNAGEDASDSLFVISTGAVDVQGNLRDREKVCFWGASPNPVASTTEIAFYLPAEAPVYLEVFDAAGRLVARLADGRRMESGVHRIPWSGRRSDGSLLSSGVYFCLLRTDGVRRSKKVVLAR